LKFGFGSGISDLIVTTFLTNIDNDTQFPNSSHNELMSITVFILTTLCLRAGNTPTYMQDYVLLSLNTTGVKEAFHHNTTAGLPIHNVCNLYIMTTCSATTPITPSLLWQA
jgi:hypothetical protein